MYLHRSFVIIIAAAALFAGCSGSVEFSFGGQTPAEAAVDLIEGDAMAQRLGLDDITDAVCDEPADRNVGTVFSCTASSDGDTIEFDVELEADDRIFAGPTNVIGARELDAYASSAVASLNAANGFTLPEDSLDCGARTVVLDADRQMLCQLTDPATGTVYDTVLTVRNTELGTFDVEILDAAG